METNEKFDIQLIEEFKAALEEKNTENEVQNFLESHSRLIPMPFLLNHHLHMNCVISKFPLGNEYVTDFAYLTKSSDYWEFVLIELEHPRKKLFLDNKENIYFSAEFNHAYDQILSWKAYIKKNEQAVLHQIDKIRVPLNENVVRFKFVLVIGRNGEKDNHEKKRAMFAEKNTDDIRVMTYDSLISQCMCMAWNPEKVILSPWKEQGFKIKKLPQKDISTSLFAYMRPEYLDVSEENMEILKQEDYQMDVWKQGNLLKYNEKYDAKTLRKSVNNPLIKAVLESIEKEESV